jgi:uncharacterized membrane protein YkoI
MKHRVTLVAFIISALATAPVIAKGGHGHHGEGLHKCLKAASKIKDGYYQKLEYLTMTATGARTYEIEIKDKNGVEWELMCDIRHGDIYEIEREVETASDPLFKKHMKVDEKTAANTALELYPGNLVHTEYEIEADGSASYEFDIYDKPGVTYKVEVDASTGEIIEVNIEKWDIGREADE